jgi:hypothetical protein
MSFHVRRVPLVHVYFYFGLTNNVVWLITCIRVFRSVRVHITYYLSASFHRYKSRLRVPETHAVG